MNLTIDTDLYDVSVTDSGFLVLDCRPCDVEILNLKKNASLTELIEAASFHSEEAH